MVNLLLQVEVAVANGKTTAQAAKEAEITDVAFRIICRNVSELFGVVQSFLCNTSRRVSGDQDHGHFASKPGTFRAGGVSRAFNKRHSSLSVIHLHLAIAPDNSETLRHLSFKAKLSPGRFDRFRLAMAYCRNHCQEK